MVSTIMNFTNLSSSKRMLKLNSKKPQVDLVVIAYNEEANIGACLASIVNQTGIDNYRVIVVDDASNDRTNEIVQAFKIDHPQVSLIRHPTNLGRGAARRTGQDACTAETIGFVDSDITLPSDWLTRVTAALSDADAVSGVAVPDGDFAVIWRIFHPKSRALPGDWAITGNNVIFRRSALEMVGWPAQSRVAEDCRMARALVEAGLTAVTLRDLQVSHREAKTYRQALAFMREMGFYSTEILRDLRFVRLPDIAWMFWVLTVLLSISLAIAGVASVPISLGIVAGATIGINLAAMIQRFKFWSAPVRWIGAACANLPLMTTYLVFRTLHIPRLLVPRGSAV